MTQATQQILTATCGDLVLAKACLAELRTAGFRGSVSLDSTALSDDWDERMTSFGSPSGETTGRGLVIGGVLGNVATLILFTTPLAARLPTTAAWAIAVANVVTGAVAGAWLARREIGRTPPDERRASRLLLRCKGTADEIAKAKRCLQDAPCQDVQPEPEQSLNSAELA